MGAMGESEDLTPALMGEAEVQESPLGHAGCLWESRRELLQESMF